MSRIGRQPVPIPPNVTITIDEHNRVVVKGPKGELSRQFPPAISFQREDETASSPLPAPTTKAIRAPSTASPGRSSPTWSPA